MPDDPDPAPTDAPSPAAAHLAERERALRASVLGVALGIFLRLVSRRRSA